jgi:hypothetical protein
VTASPAPEAAPDAAPPRQLADGALLVLGLLPAVIGVLMVTAAVDPKLIEMNKLAQVERWSGSDFANLAWLGLAASIVLFALAWWRKTAWPLTLLGVSSLTLVGCTVATFSLAWVHGRENYWDAYHFAALLWTVFGSAALSLAAFKIDGARGSLVARSLVGVSVVVVLLCLFVWTYSWSPLVQDFEGWVARFLWQATHG